MTKDIEKEININNYNTIACLSNTRNTGGAIIYIKNGIKYKIVYANEVKETFWCIAIEILECNLNGIYACFYRSNKAKLEFFYELFEEFLDKIVQNNKLILCVGDLNINLNEENTKTKEFLMTCERYEMGNIVNFNTRITQTSQTKIDVVLTNEKRRMRCVPMNEERITDHETIKISITNKEKTNFNTTQKVYSWKNYNKSQLIENLRNSEWINFERINLNDKIRILQENLENAVSTMVLNVTIKNNSNAKKWYNEELKQQKQIKIEKYNKWSSTKDEKNWIEYVEVRNKYNAMVKQKSNMSKMNEIKNAGKNQKQMWTTLKKLMPSKISNTSNEIEFENGMKTTNTIEICNNFNNYFIDSIIKINNEIPTVTECTQMTRKNYNFKFKCVNIDSIIRITKQISKKINKSEKCNAMVWNDAMDYIAYYMKLVVNESMQNGNFPDLIKTATITPIPKVTNTQKCINFRPINSMPVEEKIIEGVVKEQLLEYIEKNKILSENQSAYRKNYSCETALNYLIYECKEQMDKGDVTILVFLDLKRAFETVDRSRTMDKLKCYGINENELKWFDSYMNNRTQIVKYKDKNQKKEKYQ